MNTSKRPSPENKQTNKQTPRTKNKNKPQTTQNQNAVKETNKHPDEERKNKTVSNANHQTGKFVETGTTMEQRVQKSF